jgi:RES domain-containing protein
VIRAWRLARRVHGDPPEAKAFDGYGAQLYGGRWNSAGVPAAYAASTRSLCALEYLVHVDPDLLPDDLVFAQARFSESAVERIAALPTGWDEPGSASSVAFGDAWLRERRSLVLEVPSAVVVGELNYIINPRHSDFAGLFVSPELERFTFDERLIKRR